MGNRYPRAYKPWSRYRQDQVLYTIPDKQFLFSNYEAEKRKNEIGYNCLCTWDAGLKDDTKIFTGVR